MIRPGRLTVVGLLIVCLTTPAGADHGGDWHVHGRVSVASNGDQGNHPASSPSMSANGRWTAFAIASGLVPEDTNGLSDVYVHDLWTATTVRVSVHSDGTQANFGASAPSISGDGRYVAFESGSTTLIGEDVDGGGCDVNCDTNGVVDVYVHDRDADENGTYDEPGGIETTRVSVGSAGEQATKASFHAFISGNGRHVAFVSDLIPNAGAASGLYTDVYVHDRDTGTTTLVSKHSNGAANDDESGAFFVPGQPVVNEDGRYVFFGSAATNLVDGDGNGEDDFFLHDRDTDMDGIFDEAGQFATTRISVDTSGTEIAEPALSGSELSISADARFLTWNSCAEVPGTTATDGFNLMLTDRDVNLTRLGRIPAAEEGGACSSGAFAGKQTISADGNWIAYSSSSRYVFNEAPNFCSFGIQDISVIDRQGGTDELLTTHAIPLDCNADPPFTFPGPVNASGEYLVVGTEDTNLAPGDTNGSVVDLVMMVRGSPVFPTPTPSATPLETATPTPTVTPTATPPARLPDDADAKRAAKCGKTTNKDGAKFVANKLKILHKCGLALTKCIQTKEDGAKRDDCVTKALGKCTKDLAKIAKAEDKLEAGVVKKCTDVGVGDLRADDGLGYDGVAGACATDFGSPLDDVAGVASCLMLHHECQTEAAAEVLLPRLKELMRVAGVDPGTLDAFTCLADYGGTGADVDAPKELGKGVEKCVKETTKAGAKYLKAVLKSDAKCLDTTFACVQQKSGEAKCQAKSTKACDKAVADRAKAAAKLAGSLAKRCGEIDFATLAAGDAANLAALAGSCAEVGVGSLTVLDDYRLCVERRLTCLVEEMAHLATPRAHELGAFAGREFGSAFCPG